MPTKFEHSARFSAPVATVYSAFTSEEYWKERLAEVGGPIARLDDFEVRDDGVHVAMVQAVAEEFLPSIVTAVRKGDLEIDRTENWSPGRCRRRRYRHVHSGHPRRARLASAATSR